MTGKRILLFGANGQLGYRLTEVLGDAGHEVTALDRAACDFAVVEPKQIEVALRAVEPEMIIIAAAYTAVDKAESEPELAARINAQVPEWIALAAQAHGVPCIHFSTDYVFEGIRGAPYREDAAVKPLNVYGETKLAGEQAVLAAGGHVFRLQWVVDHRGKNFVLTMQRALKEREELRVVADQFGSPSYAKQIAECVAQAVPMILAKSMPSGVYHLSAGGYTSWQGLTCAIAELTGSRARVVPITSAEYPLPATRPLNTRLDSSLLAAYGIQMPHWRAGIAALLSEQEPS